MTATTELLIARIIQPFSAAGLPADELSDIAEAIRLADEACGLEGKAALLIVHVSPRDGLASKWCAFTVDDPQRIGEVAGRLVNEIPWPVTVIKLAH